MKWKQHVLNFMAGLLVLCSVAGYLKYSLSFQKTDAPVVPKKRVALTFDDGPNADYTGELLKGLKKRKVRGTFFLLGEQVQRNPELVREIQKEGHLIGNHGYDHQMLTKLSDQNACNQIEKTSALLKEITGEPSLFLRPPYGEWKENLDRMVSMIPVMWTVDSMDWSLKNTDAIVEKVLKEVKDEDIILMHDGYQTSVEAAFKIVDLLQEQGYEFVTVDELILE